MGTTKKSLGEVLEAINGSGGVKTVIARRLGVARNTVDNYLDRWTTAREAYEDEESGVGDIAKSVVVGNLRAAYSLQAEALKAQRWQDAIVDTGDAKWWLKMKLRDEFSERQEITGADGGAVLIEMDWGDGGENND